MRVQHLCIGSTGALRSLHVAVARVCVPDSFVASWSAPQRHSGGEIFAEVQNRPSYLQLRSSQSDRLAAAAKAKLGELPRVLGSMGRAAGVGIFVHACSVGHGHTATPNHSPFEPRPILVRVTSRFRGQASGNLRTREHTRQLVLEYSGGSLPVTLIITHSSLRSRSKVRYNSLSWKISGRRKKRASDSARARCQAPSSRYSMRCAPAASGFNCQSPLCCLPFSS